MSDVPSPPPDAVPEGFPWVGAALGAGVLSYAVGMATLFVNHGPWGLEPMRSASWATLGLASLALAIGALEWWATRRGRPPSRRQAAPVYVALTLAGALAYTNFGHFHFGAFVHVHDVFHYLLGARYFDELGYTRLYECSEVALAESGRRAQVERHGVTDLESGDFIRTTLLLSRPDERCRRYFSVERWRLFSDDVRLFRSWMTETEWNTLLHDHGFNGTPAWMLLGRALPPLVERLDPYLAPTFPAWKHPRTGAEYPSTAEAVAAAKAGDGATLKRYAEGLALRGAPAIRDPRTFGAPYLNALVGIDLLLLLAMFGAVGWAFGLRGLTIAALMLGCIDPGRFSWTGGALLRQDWLFWLVASVCLLKRGRGLTAGGALAFATQLRLFPVLVVLGPLLVALAAARRRQHDPLAARFGLGFVAWGVVVTGLTLIALPSGQPASSYLARATSDGATTAVQIERRPLGANDVSWLSTPIVVASALPPGLRAEQGAGGALVLSGTTEAAGALTVGLEGATHLTVHAPPGAPRAALVEAWVDGFNDVYAGEAAVDPLRSWRAFAANMSKHSRLRSANTSGAPAVAWALAGHDRPVDDEGAPLSSLVINRHFELDLPMAANVVLLLFQCAAALALAWAIQRSEAPAWLGAALACGLAPVFFNLAGYYLVVLIPLSLAAVDRRGVALLCLAFAAGTNASALATGDSVRHAVGLSALAIALVLGAWLAVGFSSARRPSAER
ncbi:MAG: hypothetical protein JNG84_01765 [Archangium sp.]|nr:hypothetical protein [Archangium sp.]